MSTNWVEVSVIAAAIGAIAAVILKGGEIISKSIGFLKGMFKGKGQTDHIPVRTLVVQVEPRINALWWSRGSSG